ncbi:MAG: spoVD 2 [Chthoniobacteraceae bacterium]|nr:spoVD 2 [Chthoniobacteraceae bacterium]
MGKVLYRLLRGDQIEMRLLFFGIVMGCGFVALGWKLWIVQVVQHAHWAEQMPGPSRVTVRVPSVRGEIRDRNGIILVTNRSSYGVDFHLSDMVRGFKKQNGYIPLTRFKAPVHQMLTEKSEADVVEIVNTGIMPRLQELSLARDYNAERLQKHYRTNAEVPFAYQEALDFSTVAKLAEHEDALPGVQVSLRPVRYYIYGALAAHLLGYVGAPVEIEKLADVNDYTFYQPDVEGKAQIEQSMEPYLRGKPGTRILERDSKGIIQSQIESIPPTPGNSVYLTIDARIQFIAEQALRHPALGRAAAVVLNPNNGDILAMASVPSFDPNVFIPSISEGGWKSLMQDETVPLVNRAVSAFPPGSTFKIVTALAGLEKKLENSRYDCPGGIQYGNHYFHCWISDKHRTHGVLGLSDAIKVSCDCYFYQLGNAAGIDTMDRIGAILGIGKTYEIGLSDEKAGCMPGPEWMRLRPVQEKWTSAHTANVSIGQGYVLASPLQMAIAYAAVANGGIVYEPRLVRTVINPGGTPLLNENGEPVVPDRPSIRADLRTEVTAHQIELVRHGFWEVVNEDGGTGAKGRVEGIAVGGKTGTAQATDRGKEDYVAWFCCFAPYDRPRYVIVTMVQSGAHGGSVAAPIASRILEQCIGMEKKTYKVAIEPMKPARNSHPFQRIEALAFTDNPTFKAAPEIAAAQIAAAPREETTEPNGPSRSRAQPSNNRASRRPTIRPEPDQRGQLQRRAAIPLPPPVDRRTIFQRFFGIRKPSETSRPQSMRPNLH